MSAVVRILPSGREFVAEANEPLLQAALRSGVALEFGCVNGTCGECKARVTEGEVRQIRFHDYVMSEAEKMHRTVLLCSCSADRDVTIEAAEAGGPDDIPVQKVRARLYRQDHVADDVEIVHLRVMRGRILRFLAGQHARLKLAGSEYTDLSIASCPCDGLNLEFHFDLSRKCDLSARASAGFEKSDRFDIEGPQGRFTLDEDSGRPLVFIACDTAIAAVKSIIEHAVNLEIPQPMRLHWHATREHGHYLHNYFRSLADAIDEFHYVPIQGAVSADTLGELPDPSRVDAYLTGSRGFVDAAKKLLLERGLPEDRMFIDELSRGPSSAPRA
ncbi:MAG TPA: 2Fe-2S iron-sulfur cluster-binding protein, partial [Gammaproteobacteria bacterium]|nr:2Fe-2S iron-sulfur cluster-binding protein [Gammaproteobacteria bacterium]